MAAAATYTVSGMTCGHCVAAVTEEVSKLDGVAQVTINLVPDGDSSMTVTSATPLDQEIVRHAVDEAGYDVTGVSDTL